MKTFWKVLGAALAVGLTPYKVEKNEETGETSYQALLWRITSAPGEDAVHRDIGINLGGGTLTSKLLSSADTLGEPHLFSDELCVEYNGIPVTEPAAPEAPSEPEEPAAPVEEEVPAEETPAESVEPAEGPENQTEN